MDKAAKARQAKFQKLANDYNARLRRMGLGVYAGEGNTFDREAIAAHKYLSDTAQLPDLSHLEPEIAQTYVELIGGFHSGIRAFDPTLGPNAVFAYKEPIFRLAVIPNKTRRFGGPNPLEQDPITAVRGRVGDFMSYRDDLELSAASMVALRGDIPVFPVPVGISLKAYDYHNINAPRGSHDDREVRDSRGGIRPGVDTGFRFVRRAA